MIAIMVEMITIVIMLLKNGLIYPRYGYSLSLSLGKGVQY